MKIIVAVINGVVWGVGDTKGEANADRRRRIADLVEESPDFYEVEAEHSIEVGDYFWPQVR
jgi:hypothetical protein